MLVTIEGTYSNGRVELKETPPVDATSRVIVTFLVPGPVDLAARGIDPALAGDLRARLATFAEDWNSEEMAIYDDYPTIRHSN